jgi:hypothetical protein
MTRQLDAARQKTNRPPLFVRIPKELELPSGGLLQTFV